MTERTALRSTLVLLAVAALGPSASQSIAGQGPGAFALGAAGWEAAPAEGVRLALTPTDGPGGGGLPLAFHFQGHGGYAIARHPPPLALPANYHLALWISPPAHSHHL